MLTGTKKTPKPPIIPKNMGLKNHQLITRGEYTNTQHAVNI
jgi:hypothetical protein